MTDYKLIIASKREEFEKLVKQALNEGWKCQGGVSTHDFFYSQAVTKEEKPVKKLS